jgi:hypothetical protein
MQQDPHQATDDHRKFAVTDELRLVGEGCKCLLCGQMNYFHRAGCKCWDISRMQDEEYAKSLRMEYGQLTQGNEFGGFVSYKEIHEHIKTGGKAFFWDGTEITEAMFTENSEEAEQ